MKTLKRKDCAVLPLVLKRKWYDMIDSGEKREEYRDATPYWVVRIKKWARSPGHWVVAFSKGYRKQTMWFKVRALHAPESMWRRPQEHPEWGEPDTPHYVIVLGERVNLED